MSIRHVLAKAALSSLPMLMAGCVSTSGDGQGARLSDNFEVYAPFDNERDWGPSYLIGAPNHHLGDGARVDDTRSIPPNADAATPTDVATPADPRRPPLTGSAQPGQAQAGAAPPAPPQPLP
jgi:hypothetical protein